MENIYIMSGVRTAIGKYGGSLKSVPAHTMGALVIREALSRAGIAGALVDEVILGEVRQSTEASNIARCALLEAGLPETVPGYTVNRLCASAMQAVLCGYQEIWTGQAKTVVAGGTENMAIATPIGTAVNMQILPAGYTFKDFALLGGPLWLIMTIVVTVCSVLFLL